MVWCSVIDLEVFPALFSCYRQVNHVIFNLWCITIHLWLFFSAFCMNNSTPWFIFKSKFVAICMITVSTNRSILSEQNICWSGTNKSRSNILYRSISATVFICSCRLFNRRHFSGVFNLELSEEKVLVENVRMSKSQRYDIKLLPQQLCPINNPAENQIYLRKWYFVCRSELFYTRLSKL